MKPSKYVELLGSQNKKTSNRANTVSNTNRYLNIKPNIEPSRVKQLAESFEDQVNFERLISPRKVSSSSPNLLNMSNYPAFQQ